MISRATATEVRGVVTAWARELGVSREAVAGLLLLVEDRDGSPEGEKSE